jgi:hypothetical protein
MNNFGSYCLVLPLAPSVGSSAGSYNPERNKIACYASNGGAVQLIGSTLELSAGDSLPTVRPCQNASDHSHGVCQ